MNGRTYYTLIISVIAILTISIFVYAEPVVATTVIFAAIASFIVLLSLYGFLRGTVVWLKSDRLIQFYRFQFKVLQNEVELPVDTHFITSSLKQLQQQSRDIEEIKKLLESSSEIETMVSLSQQQFSS